jgi:hypothetical protein
VTDRADRTATVETVHADHVTAVTLADAVRPDNTADVRTRVDGARIETEIERATTGGLQSSVDDYVVNLSVAAAVVASAETVVDGQTTRSRGQHSTRDDTTAYDNADHDTTEHDT